MKGIAMHERSDSEDHQLVQRAVSGDKTAEVQLLTRHRDRLKRFVLVRLDRKLSGRVDPSDVVQETLIQAAQRLSSYLELQPIPFYPWIRQLAIEQVAMQHRRHIKALGRTVNREVVDNSYLPDHSSKELATQLLARGRNPSDEVSRLEQLAMVHQAMNDLDAQDREVLALRFLEQLSTAETADVLGLSLTATKSRQRRALERFSRLFESQGGD